MGGRGTRFGAKIPKQFVEVDGHPVFTYLLEAYEQFDEVDSLYIVCHKDWIPFTEKWITNLKLKKVKKILSGGNSRSQSVQFGLNAIASQAKPSDVVLIHDVTHPFIDTENVKKCIIATQSVGAATLAGSCFDTMYKTNEEECIEKVIPREKIVSATAPECFRFDTVYPLYKDKSEEELECMTSAGAMMVANGQPVKVIRTPFINLKITLYEDMEAFKKLLHGYYYK